MYFLCMKTFINDEPMLIVSEHSNDVMTLVELVKNAYEILRRRDMPDMVVIDNDMNKLCFSDASVRLIDNSIIDFEWKFYDKYNRAIHCYMTRNV